MTEITMPKLSDTMTEGVLGEWKKSVGDQVSKGDIIAEVETDKATMELEAFTSGILVEQRVRAGETIAVGAVIGVIGEAEQATKTSAPVETKPAAPAEVRVTTSEAKPPAHVEHEPPAPAEEAVLPDENQQTAEFRLPAPGPETDLHEETGKMGSAPEQQVEARTTESDKAASGEKSAPVVRRRAHELGIDLAAVNGSGPGGRVLLDDLEKYAGMPKASGRKEAEEAAPEERKEAVRPRDAQVHREGESHAFNRMQAAIAKTVSESWRSIPHFSVVQDIRMDRAEQTRRELKINGVRVSLTDMIIKAAALALLKFPKVNSVFNDKGIIYNKEINIGIMAKVPDGLLVPVVKGCQALSLLEISGSTRKLLERVRGGTVTESEISGGTFSISNLGMYDITLFTAIILPPQVAILATGTVCDVVKGGKGVPTVERYMKATLSADHRVLDGVEAATFLKELKRILENPVQLLL
ncbi:dihydrolipoamide acetyltransferase family protein [Pelotalea chapellei]|uniref:Dihydrolipoamide acetyltransferase component of pyruvate dehydrogenase complex n=1 Tax=Pelotalea chapellei TaxID=44671 RepID=A0ABS5U9U9_9BACT|nr:dihydrolipoamide acetyltransferase family protein [Pelotalea chapellei]MBT1072435.1 2-oxo acid dehydrogenase subunit E2 [Pelotalea chapellei]